MIPDDFNYAKTYSSMADDELLEISRDSVDLEASAKAALRKELDNRGLKPEPDKGMGSREGADLLYCPNCKRAVDDPLTCGECSSVICRVCGTALKMPEDVDAEGLDPKNRT